jgi:hypothetical protein
MSRGPGKVQRAIREWLEEFPGLVHDIGELACHAYPIDGGKVEKASRRDHPRPGEHATGRLDHHLRSGGSQRADDLEPSRRTKPCMDAVRQK